MTEELKDKIRGWVLISSIILAAAGVVVYRYVSPLFESTPQTTKTLSVLVTDAQLSARRVCVIDMDTESHCTDVRKVEVKANPTLPGTVATVYTRTYMELETYGRVYPKTENDWITIYVRTEQQRKDYQAKIDYTLKKYYGARDVKIRTEEP